jgi:hypothetical protein
MKANIEEMLEKQAVKRNWGAVRSNCTSGPSSPTPANASGRKRQTATKNHPITGNCDGNCRQFETHPPPQRTTQAVLAPMISSPKSNGTASTRHEKRLRPENGIFDYLKGGYDQLHTLGSKASFGRSNAALAEDRFPNGVGR